MRTVLLAAVWVGSVLAGQDPAPLGTLVDAGGYRAHLYCVGEGSPAVIVAGGFSVDWALVQPEVAKFTRICTYDTAGAAWSEASAKAGTCKGRVQEIHTMLGSAAVKGPYVFVGFSVGGLIGRSYAGQYRDDLVGMVFVDHAFTPKPKQAAADASAPQLIFQTPIMTTVEDTSDFKKLPARMQELHRWAEARKPVVDQAVVADDCLLNLPAGASLGNMPLAVVSTANEAPGYAELQKELMSLSTRSYQLKAERSFHSVEIDQPEAVIRAIRRVVEESRR